MSRFTEESRFAEVRGTVVADEPLQKQYGSARFLPDRIIVSLVKSAGEEWLVLSVRLAGPNVKKDGTLGANRHDYLYSRKTWGDGAWYDAIPEWAAAIAEEICADLNGRDRRG